MPRAVLLAAAAVGALLSGPRISLGSVFDPAAGEGADAAAMPARPRWVQIAYSGSFKGHASGEFEFTRDLFAQVIANFRAHPSYKAGAEGSPPVDLDAGRFDVVPWDFHHASEQAPTSGTIPVAGAPAQAWVCELAIRDQPDGSCQLWAYTRFLDPLRQYVREGRYKWCSVSLYMNARDPQSGAPIGPYLSSVAATNDPFLQGMVPLVASRSDADARALHGGRFYEDADTPAEVVDRIRQCLDLPVTSSVEEVGEHLGKLQAWALGTAPPPVGVDVADIVADVRRILNLPTLADASTVFQHVAALLQSVAVEATEGADEAPPSSRSGAAPPAGATVPTEAGLDRKDTADMDPKLLARIAAALKTTADQKSVETALAVMLDKGGVGAMDSLGAILSALGVEDVPSAQKKIADMFGQVAALEAAMPELAALREQKAATEEAAAEGEVDEAMTAHRMPKEARTALLFMRKSDPKKFAADYPVAPKAQRHLTSPVFAGGPTSGTGSPVNASASGGRSPAALLPGASGGPVDLSSYPGANITVKALAYVEATTPPEKFARMSRDERFYAARQAVKLARG